MFKRVKGYYSRIKRGIVNALILTPERAAQQIVKDVYDRNCGKGERTYLLVSSKALKPARDYHGVLNVRTTTIYKVYDPHSLHVKITGYCEFQAIGEVWSVRDRMQLDIRVGDDLKVSQMHIIEDPVRFQVPLPAELAQEQHSPNFLGAL